MCVFDWICRGKTLDIFSLPSPSPLHPIHLSPSFPPSSTFSLASSFLTCFLCTSPLIASSLHLLLSFFRVNLSLLFPSHFLSSHITHYFKLSLSLFVWMPSTTSNFRPLLSYASNFVSLPPPFRSHLPSPEVHHFSEKNGSGGGGEIARARTRTRSPPTQKGILKVLLLQYNVPHMHLPSTHKRTYTLSFRFSIKWMVMSRRVASETETSVCSERERGRESHHIITVI